MNAIQLSDVADLVRVNSIKLSDVADLVRVNSIQLSDFADLVGSSCELHPAVGRC